MGRTVHLLCLLATLGCAAGRSLAAISVGAGGAGPITFDTLPDGSDFSTRVWAGASADITTAAALNAAVQTNSAVLLSAPLAASGGESAYDIESSLDLLRWKPVLAVTNS